LQILVFTLYQWIIIIGLVAGNILRHLCGFYYNLLVNKIKPPKFDFTKVKLLIVSLITESFSVALVLLPAAENVLSLIPITSEMLLIIGIVSVIFGWGGFDIINMVAKILKALNTIRLGVPEIEEKIEEKLGSLPETSEIIEAVIKAAEELANKEQTPQ